MTVKIELGNLSARIIMCIMILLKLLPAHLKRGGGEIPMLLTRSTRDVVKLIKI